LKGGREGKKPAIPVTRDLPTQWEEIGKKKKGGHELTKAAEGVPIAVSTVEKRMIGKKWTLPQSLQSRERTLGLLKEGWISFQNPSAKKSKIKIQWALRGSEKPVPIETLLGWGIFPSQF